MKTYVYGKTCTPQFIAALSIVAPKQKQLECPLVMNGKTKQWHIHATEYCLAIKRNEDLIHAIRDEI